MQSATSVRHLYPEFASAKRSGICLSHHSRDVVEPAETAALMEFGPVRTEWASISDIHRAELQSDYFMVHPRSMRTAGLALIEAVSAGCVALAPSERLWDFPELVVPELDFATFDELVALLRELEADPERAHRCQREQQTRVQEWCYSNPAHNLEALHESFLSSRATPRRQHRAETCACVRSVGERTALRVARRMGGTDGGLAERGIPPAARGRAPKPRGLRRRAVRLD